MKNHEDHSNRKTSITNNMAPSSGTKATHPPRNRYTESLSSERGAAAESLQKMGVLRHFANERTAPDNSGPNAQCAPPHELTDPLAPQLATVQKLASPRDEGASATKVVFTGIQQPPAANGVRTTPDSLHGHQNSQLSRDEPSIALNTEDQIQEPIMEVASRRASLASSAGPAKAPQGDSGAAVCSSSSPRRKLTLADLKATGQVPRDMTPQNAKKLMEPTVVAHQFARHKLDELDSAAGEAVEGRESDADDVSEEELDSNDETGALMIKNGINIIPEEQDETKYRSQQF